MSLYISYAIISYAIISCEINEEGQTQAELVDFFGGLFLPKDKKQIQETFDAEIDQQELEPNTYALVPLRRISNAHHCIKTGEDLGDGSGADEFVWSEAEFFPFPKTEEEAATFRIQPAAWKALATGDF